jgi:hypothetical protein
MRKKVLKLVHNKFQQRYRDEVVVDEKRNSDYPGKNPEQSLVNESYEYVLHRPRI